MREINLITIMKIMIVSFTGMFLNAQDIIFSDDFDYPDSDVVGNGWIDIPNVNGCSGNNSGMTADILDNKMYFEFDNAQSAINIYRSFTEAVTGVDYDFQISAASTSLISMRALVTFYNEDDNELGHIYFARFNECLNQCSETNNETVFEDREEGVVLGNFYNISIDVASILDNNLTGINQEEISQTKLEMSFGAGWCGSDAVGFIDDVVVYGVESSSLFPLNEADFIFFISADNQFLVEASNGNSFTKLLNEVSDAGFEPAYIDLRTNIISQSTLDQKKVVMFLGGALMNREFSADEISTFDDFVQAGGGIFFTGNKDINKLTEIFGIFLSGNTVWPLHNIDATYFTSNAITTGISRITGDAGDEITIVTPAEYIGWTEEGGTPLLAKSEVGLGRVILWYGVGIFLDATIPANAYQSNIDEYDNRQFLRNALKWLRKNEVPNLVAYYPFNGNAKDASGNGNDGINNDATLIIDRFGNYNSAYSFDGGKYKAFYEVLLHTGIRTDCYKLAKKHLQGRYLTLRMNKTGGRLSIPLSNHIISTLEALSGQCEFDETLLFKSFKSDRQKKNCVKTMQSNFTADFVRKNNINLHTFRHTYAHNMLNKGVPKEVLQTLLGHRSIKTTEIYANWVRKEELERWV